MGRLHTAPFGALSLFDELATKLQLRDKVASRQRDYALHRGSAQSQTFHYKTFEPLHSRHTTTGGRVTSLFTRKIGA